MENENHKIFEIRILFEQFFVVFFGAFFITLTLMVIFTLVAANITFNYWGDHTLSGIAIFFFYPLGAATCVIIHAKYSLKYNNRLIIGFLISLLLSASVWPVILLLQIEIQGYIILLFIPLLVTILSILGLYIAQKV